jgi:NAD+ diphosphatase
VLTDVTLPYNGLILDRSSRTDPEQVERAKAHPGSRAFMFWRDSCLVRDGRPVYAHPSELDDSVFLGMDGEAGMFAADLTSIEDPADVVDIRRLFNALPAQESAALAYARGILHWNRNQRFCGACGGTTQRREAGHLRACQGCGKLLFPRIEPAVIMLVETIEPARCLLARHKGAAADAFSTLAGFVEIGESLEDAVRRELHEEAGVRVAQVRYQASQAWPFPAGLMIGFRAVAASDAVAVDEDELLEARWFTREEIVARLAAGDNRVDSIEHFLVQSWVHDRS